MIQTKMLIEIPTKTVEKINHFELCVLTDTWDHAIFLLPMFLV